VNSSSIRRTSAPDEPSVFQIRVKGHLDQQWTDWFYGFSITLEEGGDTLLTGRVADQATLHGLIKKVRDLGIPLVSINPVVHDRADTSAKKNAQPDK
jgi:hypothetical protein